MAPAAPRATASEAVSGERTTTPSATDDVMASIGPSATNRPRSITTRRSTVCDISASRWLETKTVRPALANARRNPAAMRPRPDRARCRARRVRAPLGLRAAWWPAPAAAACRSNSPPPSGRQGLASPPGRARHRPGTRGRRRPSPRSADALAPSAPDGTPCFAIRLATGRRPCYNTLRHIVYCPPG